MKARKQTLFFSLFRFSFWKISTCKLFSIFWTTRVLGPLFGPLLVPFRSPFGSKSGPLLVPSLNILGPLLNWAQWIMRHDISGDSFFCYCLTYNLRIQLFFAIIWRNDSGYWLLSFELSDMTFQDTACTKKGLDPQMFTLEYKGKKVDLSSTVSPSIVHFRRMKSVKNTMLWKSQVHL